MVEKKHAEDDKFTDYKSHKRLANRKRSLVRPRAPVIKDVVSWRASSRMIDALAEATILHGAQARKGTSAGNRVGTAIPYLGHLLGVCSIVIDNRGTEDEAIAALLHDAAEDQGGKTTLAQIRRQFGPRVAEIVEHCSDTFVEPKPEWKVRKARYIGRLRKNRDPSVYLVSVADKLHNARCTETDYKRLGEELWRRFNAGRDDTLSYYEQLIDVYRQREPIDERRGAIVDELASIIAAMRKMAAVGADRGRH